MNNVTPNHDEETTYRERDNARMPPAAPLVDKDRIRDELRKGEDAMLDAFRGFAGVDERWRALAVTHLQMSFMFIKRAVYDGKRVGDP
jgi:hypothetical protein